VEQELPRHDQRHSHGLVGVDLAPEAVVFCRKVHRRAARFEVGDAEHLPFDDGAFDVVTNIESSHTYPNLRAFFAEVRRVLVSGGRFLSTDLLPVQRWMEFGRCWASSASSCRTTGISPAMCLLPATT
jgi:ubiquinone/menaquinone biosynthesis C-methylase UbiE